MLFTYAADRNTGFWMYNTYVPIEILYIDHSGDVVDKITMSPCLRETASDDEWIAKCAAESAAYVPGGSWRYTLELPVGWLAAQGADDSMIQEMNVSGPAIVQ
jgi:uncharacterized membrane protein (UPF0127 family)